MGENRSLLTALGAILGLVLFIFVIMQAVSYYQKGAADFQEMQRQAGEPVLLSETLHENGGGTAEGATVDAGTEVTTTAALTETGAMTATAPVTTSETMSATEAITDTSTPVTETTAVTATTPVSATEPVTATEAVTAAEAVTATAPVTSTEAVTTAEVVTATAAVTESTAATETAPAETATTEEAPTEEVALAVPSPEEVAPIFTKAGCIGCHTIPNIPGAVGVIGPNLTGIGTTAETRVPGLSASEYLHQSILEPNAFIVPECPSGPCLPGLMVQNLGDVLTPEEIDNVVAYLLSLKSE